MASTNKRLGDSFLKFLSKRKKQAVESSNGQAPEPQEAILLDTISLESILTHRGQNPFPEEEGEIGFMNCSLRERSLL